jgi:hypothetical protein
VIVPEMAASPAGMALNSFVMSYGIPIARRERNGVSGPWRRTSCRVAFSAVWTT